MNYTPTPSPPPNQSILRLHIEGVDELGNDVRLGHFIEKLEALRAALLEVGKLAEQPDAKVDFLVSDLTHSSPAMIELSAVDLGETKAASEVVSDFLTFVRRAGSRTLEVDSRHAKLVRDLRKLVVGRGEKFKRLWLDGPAVAPIQLDEVVAKALEDALPDVVRQLGSVKGVVKKYIGVGDKPYFKLIPPVGGTEIKCVFPIEMLDEAASAVEHGATVEGELKSYEGDLWPHEIAVRSIQIHPADDELPTLSSIAGRAPDATGEQSTIDFVRGLRGEW
ncbi:MULTISPECIES: hypothetical protein [Stenotrophomonas]|uniref:hypothetical protein n=1 Tax=Stenotrophomonas TaxID=40323 RepID=UPI000871CFDC|nr:MULTISPECIES: hypothetical protein [Stenotrophomonas]OEZ01243.1 hypothetical protein BIY45_07355 [Stenotrophomonas sp. BIIR7]